MVRPVEANHIVTMRTETGRSIVDSSAPHANAYVKDPFLHGPEVIANIPTFFDRGTTHNVENYTLDDGGHM